MQRVIDGFGWRRKSGARGLVTPWLGGYHKKVSEGSRRSPWFWAGVTAQVIGWTLLFFGFLVAWTSHFQVTAFRYEGF